ncbi:AAA family ATPase [Cylindrospermopsis raciborskii]|nr:AAA family ATPase [Cylindrospermopsis raciborskii]NLQ06188.1 AAA family ATPase [Cylindrospermopsis raciborskii MVCC19]
MNPAEGTNMLLGERKNSSQLRSFSINRLFGFKDIKILFDKEATILIAENGAGKTTILNALYYTISCKFDKLRPIEFGSIILEFASGETVEIKKDDLDLLDLNELGSKTLLRKLRPFLPIEEIEILGREANISPESFRRRLEMVSRRYRIPNSSILEFAGRIEKELDPENPKHNPQELRLYRTIRTIKKSIGDTILYFPTYRRIEEELKNLGYEEEKLERLNFGDKEDKLIQFGMDDVITKLEKIKTDIKNSALNLFSKVTGEILTQFIENLEITKEMRDRIQPETLSIVLSRVGEKNISTSDKEKIKKLVSSKQINDGKHDYLVYFLSKMVSLYEQQKEKDNSINQFASKCNGYLNKKRIVYDEANVDISIIETTRGNSPIDFKNLSSGEKQIISLFSKLYLESSGDFILLFDEPELSLSIEWQRLLLPDILESGRCKLLLAATHSPFIFDNDLDLNAKDLDSFVCGEKNRWE